jgi:hypothetical protein
VVSDLLRAFADMDSASPRQAWVVLAFLVTGFVLLGFVPG